MGVKIQRDHVMRKEGLISRLLNGDETTRDILKGTVHRVVTEEEHKCLTLFDKQNKSIDGWKRYEACKIEVYDFAGDKKRII